MCLGFRLKPRVATGEQVEIRQMTARVLQNASFLVVDLN